MNILWVKAGKLFPVDTGGRIRSYNILRHLARRHDVTLLSYYGGQRDKAYEDAIQQQVPGALLIPTYALEGSRLACALDYVRHLPSRAPYAVTKFTSRAVRRRLEACMLSQRFDVAVCDFLSASLNFPSRLTTPTVLFQHNVESVLWRRQAECAPTGLTRRAFGLEAAKMARYERAILGRFHHIIAVSEADRDQMSAMVDPALITVVPTGVDLQEFCPSTSPEPVDKLVIFVGSMDWEANIDAVDYFCHDIWPLVRARLPEARFRIIGRNPHPQVRRLASETIEVTGGVPSVAEHLRQASVVVVPLRVGGGTRLKIYEAMATGRAVVSTSVGAEGLDVHPGRDILLADNALGFAECVARLLEDVGLRQRLGKAASASAAQRDWPVIAERFAEVLERVAHAAAANHREAPVAGSLKA